MRLRFDREIIMRVRKLLSIILAVLLCFALLLLSLASCGERYTATRVLSYRSAPFSFEAEQATADGEIVYGASGEYKNGTLTVTFDAPSGLAGCRLKAASDGSFLLEMPDNVLLPMPRDAVGGAAELFELLNLDGGDFKGAKRVSDDGAAMIRAVFESEERGGISLCLNPDTMKPIALERGGASVKIKWLT